MRVSSLPDRHIHFSPEDALTFGVKDRDVVSIKIDGIKAGLLDNVLCRVHESFRLDCHLDTDDGAAFMLRNGDMVSLVKKISNFRLKIDKWHLPLFTS